MQPDVGSPPKIRFEGEGTVLTEPPRPRRRASDLYRPGDAGPARRSFARPADRPRRLAAPQLQVPSRLGAAGAREVREPLFALRRRTLSTAAAILVLAVEPDHRLGAGEAVEEPPSLPEEVLDAVLVPDRRDTARRRSRRAATPSTSSRKSADHRHRQVDVPASVGEGAELRGEVSQRAVQVPARQRPGSHRAGARRARRRARAGGSRRRSRRSPPRPRPTSPSIHPLGDVLESDRRLRSAERRAPGAMRSIRRDVEKVFAIPPESPRRRKACRSSRARIWWGETKRPAASRTPSRSASPSCATHEIEALARATLSAAAARFEAMGSGWTPPKRGSRSARKETTRGSSAADDVRDERARGAVHRVGQDREPRRADGLECRPARRGGPGKAPAGRVSRIGRLRGASSGGRSAAFDDTAAYISGGALPPKWALILKPLYCAGIVARRDGRRRPARPSLRTWKETAGVGIGRSVRRTSIPARRRLRPPPAANSGEKKRVSCPMTMRLAVARSLRGASSSGPRRPRSGGSRRRCSRRR